MPTSSTVVIFIELPVMHWHFDPMLNASVMVMRAAMRVYMFHSHKFHAPVMSSFFSPQQLFDDITLDDIRTYFPSPRYLTDGESDSDTWLMPTISLDSDPSKLFYPSYHVESDPSEPSCPSMIRLIFDLSFSSVAPHHIPPPVRGRGFICTRAIPRIGVLNEENMAMTLQVVSGMVTSSSMVDLDSACGAKHEDSPFWL